MSAPVSEAIVGKLLKAFQKRAVSYQPRFIRCLLKVAAGALAGDIILNIRIQKF